MSSDSEPSCVEYDSISKNIIIEVEKRPALYDKSLNQYRDRNIKARLWQEVYQNVCKDWASLSEAEKKDKGNSIQKKWKNMKDSFAKELAVQQGRSGQAATSKKKKYIHFDSMLFLINSMQKRETSSNVLSPNSTQDITFSTTTQNSQSTSNNRKFLRKKNCSRDHNLTDIDQQLLNILKNKQVQDDDDEEKNFALMLVPMLRRLNEDQKHYAKIEILNILKKARTHPSPQPSELVFNQPLQFRSKINSSPFNHQTYNSPHTTYQYQYSPQSSSMDTIYSQSPSPTMPPPSPSPQSSTTIQQAQSKLPTMPQNPSSSKRSKKDISPLYVRTYTPPQTSYQYQYSPQSSVMGTIYSLQSPSLTMPLPSPSPQSSTTIQQAQSKLPTMPQNRIQIIEQQILNPASETANYLTHFVNQIQEQKYTEE